MFADGGIGCAVSQGLASAGSLGEHMDRACNQVRLFGAIAKIRRPLVHPTVQAYFVSATLQDLRNRLRMQDLSHPWHKERSGHLMPLQQPEEPRQPGSCAILTQGLQRGFNLVDWKFVVNVESNR